MTEIDVKDRKILHLLQDDGRLSTTDLASRVHLSPTATAERVKRLTREEVRISTAEPVSPIESAQHVAFDPGWRNNWQSISLTARPAPAGSRVRQWSTS